MKQIIIFLLVVLSFTATVIADEKTEICISRNENNGVLNIKPAEITINEKHFLWIFGGERKCCEIESGQYIIIAQSPDPYYPNDKNPATWKSVPLTLAVQAGAKVEILLRPIAHDAEYAGWELK